MIFSSPGSAFPPREYAAIIFDCDGTLTDSMPLHYLAWRQTMAEYGVQFSEERFYALGGMPSDKIVALLSAEQGIFMDVAAVAKRKEAAFVEFLPRLEPVECIMQVAASYRGKLPMAVASGGFRPVIEAQLAHLNCLEWFSAIVTAEDTQRHKPQPDVFLTAAERLGVSAEECLVYEDADLGLQAAAAANMDAIDVRAFHSPKPL